MVIQSNQFSCIPVDAIILHCRERIVLHLDNDFQKHGIISLRNQTVHRKTLHDNRKRKMIINRIKRERDLFGCGPVFLD